MEENMHDLARDKKIPTFILRPSFRPHNAPVPFPWGRSHVTEPHLNSPWEGSGSGSCCTPASLAFVHSVHPVSNLSLRDKVIPPADTELFA